MRKSFWSAALCALLVLAALPGAASAAFTPRITNVAAVESGCYPKSPLALPIPSQGVNNGSQDYRIQAVIGSIDQAPCAVLNVNVPVNYGTHLTWQAAPGAESYEIFRGNNLIATRPADDTTCAPTNAGDRCSFFDTGAIAGTPDTPKDTPPEFLQAGAHPDLSISQLFDYGGADTNNSSDDPAPNGSPDSPALRTNILHFPPGLVASAVATDQKCTLEQFRGAPATDAGGAGSADAQEDSCPRASLVGSFSARIQTAPVAPQNPPRPAVGDIYLGETTGSEAARLYAVLRPACSAGYPAPLNPGGPACTAQLGSAAVEVEKSFLSAKATIRPGDYGLDNETVSVAHADEENLARTTSIRVSANGAKAGEVPIQVRALTQNLFGFADQGTEDRTDNGAFVRLPTSCLPKTLSASASSYMDPTPVTANALAPLTPINCPAVPFAPTISTVLDASGQTGQNAHPEFTATIGQSPDEAAMKKATVVLPAGLGTNIAALGRACTEAQAASAAGCPATSRVGTASAVVPVLEGVLSGPVFIAENPGSASALPKLIVDLRGAANIKFDGEIGFADNNTRLVNTFDNLPEVTLTSFSLRIDGGSDGLLSNGVDLCSNSLGNVDAEFVGHNGATVSRAPGVDVRGLEYYCVPPPNPCKASKPKQSLSVKGVGKNRTKIKSKIRRGNGCGKSNLRKTRMKLAKGLKFTKQAKKKITVRANGKKVKFKAKGRNLTINTKRNTKNIRISTKNKAIQASRKVRSKGKKQTLKFVTRQKVQGGKTYKINKKVKPKS